MSLYIDIFLYIIYIKYYFYLNPLGVVIFYRMILCGSPFVLMCCWIFVLALILLNLHLEILSLNTIIGSLPFHTPESIYKWLERLGEKSLGNYINGRISHSPILISVYLKNLLLFFVFARKKYFRYTVR